MTKKKPNKNAYGLFDAKGELFGFYETEEDAKEESWGPRFRPFSTIVEYVRSDKRAKRIPASNVPSSAAPIFVCDCFLCLVGQTLSRIENES
jgi:hypothetical protein